MKRIKEKEIVAHGEVSVKQIKEGNDQKRELRGRSRGVGRRGRDTDAVDVITLFTVISHFISQL